MFRSWISYAFALAAMVAFAGTAQADINAFNAAVARNDYKAAAAEAESVWQTWNKSDKDTALVAREFGFAAYMSGRHDLAKQFGQFLVEQGAALPTPDTQPVISAVLLRAAEFALSSGDKETAALRQALLARNQTGGVDMTSVVAWERLYRAGWSKAAWTETERDAAAAGEFFKRAPSLLIRQRSAEILRAAAAYRAERLNDTTERNRPYFLMADVHDALSDDIGKFKDPAVLKQLWPLKWTSEAWTLAIGAYLESSDRQVGSHISSRLKARDLVQPKFGQVPEDEATRSVPICEGAFQGEKLRYPTSKAFDGQVGSVIARVETDKTGKVINVEVLASVPADEFSTGVVSSLKKWTYKPSKKPTPGSCRLNFRNYTYRVQFNIIG